MQEMDNNYTKDEHIHRISMCKIQFLINFHALFKHFLPLY